MRTAQPPRRAARRARPALGATRLARIAVRAPWRWCPGGRSSDHRRQPSAVCASPVDPPAVGALRELVIRPAGPGQQPVLDLAFGYLGERAVALEAPGPGGQRRSEPV